MKKWFFPVCLLLSFAAHAADYYAVTDLGTFGGDDSVAFGINESGQVVGRADNLQNIDTAFVWENGVMTSIESWASFPFSNSTAFEINDNGVIIGRQGTTSVLGFAAANGSVIYVSSGSGNEYARDINNSDELLLDRDSESEIVDLTTNSVTELGFLAAAINNVNQAVGLGVLLENGSYTQLGDLGNGGTSARDINDAGQIVGESYYGVGLLTPFLWDAVNGMVDLGRLGGSIGTARGIDEQGNVVGITTNESGAFRATLWEGGGPPIDLNDEVVDLSGWQYLSEAFDINSKGQIVGVGLTEQGDRHAFLLTVVDVDRDHILDDVDNCIEISNPGQRDSDGDGFGNACDPDLTNDGIVNAQDLGLFKTVYFSNDADADFNGDGMVNAIDLATMVSFFFNPPGPSALAP